ncbi:uncharacterized protein Fot_32976 [Forsythia ovata]|uniref:Uncharacterized protein n=1 Tax=Forsythia ovata TaxID=205694 RepID=A0ABD1NWP6_9LAMI
MKLVVFLLIAIMVCSCMAAAPRRALISSSKIHNKEQQKHVEKLQEIAPEIIGRGYVRPAGYPDATGSVDNHHNIPRQYYGQWGSSNGGDGGDTPNDINGSG